MYKLFCKHFINKYEYIIHKLLYINVIFYLLILNITIYFKIYIIAFIKMLTYCFLFYKYKVFD